MKDNEQSTGKLIRDLENPFSKLEDILENYISLKASSTLDTIEALIPAKDKLGVRAIKWYIRKLKDKDRRKDLLNIIEYALSKKG